MMPHLPGYGPEPLGYRIEVIPDIGAGRFDEADVSELRLDEDIIRLRESDEGSLMCDADCDGLS